MPQASSALTATHMYITHYPLYTSHTRLPNTVITCVTIHMVSLTKQVMKGKAQQKAERFAV